MQENDSPIHGGKMNKESNFASLGQGRVFKDLGLFGGSAAVWALEGGEYVLVERDDLHQEPAQTFPAPTLTEILGWYHAWEEAGGNLLEKKFRRFFGEESLYGGMETAARGIILAAKN